MKIIKKQELQKKLKIFNINIELEKIKNNKIIDIKENFKLQIKKSKNNCFYYQLLKF